MKTTVNTDTSGKWVNIDEIDNVVHQVVSECLAIISDRRNYNSNVRTTFDQCLADGVASDLTKAIKTRFDIK